MDHSKITWAFKQPVSLACLMFMSFSRNLTFIVTLCLASILVVPFASGNSSPKLWWCQVRSNTKEWLGRGTKNLYYCLIPPSPACYHCPFLEMNS